MRMCRKQGKKRMIFVLLLALLISMVRPFGSYADEPRDGADAVDVNVEELREDGSNAEKNDLDMPNSDSNAEENNLDMPDADSDGENSEQQKERAGGFESDAPVIEEEIGRAHV